MTNRTKLGVTHALAYILIYLFQLVGGIVFLITDRDDREIRYHSLMSSYMCIAMVVSGLLLKLLSKLPIIGWLFSFTLWLTVIAYIGTMLLSMIRALNGSRLKVPFFSALAGRNA